MSHLRLALICGFTFSFPFAAFAQSNSPPSPVTVTDVVERQLSAAQTVVGSVTPARRSIVGSAVDARVEKFFVNAGDAVEKDAPLVQLMTGTLQIELRAARAELNIREAELAELKNGALPEEITQSKQRLAATAAVLRSRKSRYDRAKTLYKKEAITDELLQDAFSSFEEATANHAAAEAAHQLLMKGPRPEQIARAEAQLLFQSEQVKLIEDRIQKHTIRAPFSGFISMENTEVGQWAQRGDPMVEIVELASVNVEIFLSEKYLPNLRLGTVVRVDIPALASHVFSGEVTRIVPQANTRARSFPVHVHVKNTTDESGPLIKSGMMARVPLPVGEQRKAMLVPKDSVVLGGREPVIFVVRRENGTAQVEQVPVSLGVMDGELIEISARNVRSGQQVVVRGNERLRDGQTVTAVEQNVTQQTNRTTGAEINRAPRKQ